MLNKCKSLFNCESVIVCKELHKEKKPCGYSKLNGYPKQKSKDCLSFLSNNIKGSRSNVGTHVGEV